MTAFLRDPSTIVQARFDLAISVGHDLLGGKHVQVLDKWLSQ